IRLGRLALIFPLNVHLTRTVKLSTGVARIRLALLIVTQPPVPAALQPSLVVLHASSLIVQPPILVGALHSNALLPPTVKLPIRATAIQLPGSLIAVMSSVPAAVWLLWMMQVVVR